MNAGVIVLIVLGSLLVDAIVFFVFMLPRIRRTRFLAFLKERGFDCELDGMEVSSARGRWADIPCGIVFEQAGGRPHSLLWLELPMRFPGDALVRFVPGEGGRPREDELARLRERLHEGTLLEIESDEEDLVKAFFADPGIVEPLQKVLRLPAGWTCIEAGQLVCNLPLVVRRREFVIWILDGLLPLAQAIHDAARRMPAEGRASGPAPSPFPPAPVEPAPGAPSGAPTPDPGPPTAGGVARRLRITVERTETTMGFDLPEAYQWGVTVLGTDGDGRKVRVIVPREQSDAVRSLESGAHAELDVRAAETPSADDRLIFYSI